MWGYISYDFICGLYLMEILGGGTMKTEKVDKAQVESVVIRFRHAIEWALGIRGHFKQRGVGDGPLWWRKELQKRAGLKWDGKKFVDV